MIFPGWFRSQKQMDRLYEGALVHAKQHSWIDFKETSEMASVKSSTIPMEDLYCAMYAFENLNLFLSFDVVLASCCSSDQLLYLDHYLKYTTRVESLVRLTES